MRKALQTTLFHGLRTAFIFIFVATWMYTALPSLFSFPPKVPEARAAIGLVQHRSTFSSGNSNPLSLAFASNNTAGDLLIVAAGRGGGNPAVSLSVSDSLGNTYVVATSISGTLNSNAAIWYAVNSKGGANTVTVNSGSGFDFAMHIYEYSGISPTNPLDQVGTLNGTGVTVSVTSAGATAQASELVFAFGYDYSFSSTWSAGSGYTLEETTKDTTDNQSSGSEDKVASVAGVQAATFTLTTGDIWLAAIATFRPAGGITVSNRSDTLSDSRPSVTSNHTLTFTVNEAISGSSTLSFTFPSGFSVADTINCGDVDAATSSPFNFNYPGCAATATTWGFTANGSVLTLQAPTDSTSTVHVATSTPMSIYIGSNATTTQQGVHRITNPSSAGAYTISLGGTSGNSGNFLVAIGGGQTVAATVAESLAFTVSSVPTIQFVQGAAAIGIGASISKAFLSNNTTGNLIVVTSRWNSSVITAAISDTEGNLYATAVPQVINFGGGASSQIWYAKNIAGGANTVSLTYSSSPGGLSELDIHEYSGIDTASPLDVTATSIGSSATATSGPATTTFANELVFGFCTTFGGGITPGAGFILRESAASGIKNITEDQTATSVGEHTVSCNLSASTSWTAEMAVFKGASGGCAGDDGAATTQVNTTASAVPFGTVLANTYYQGCQDLIVSTNAANGYSLTGQESSAMMTAGGKVIPDTTCDNGLCVITTASSWKTSTNNGFGYTCNNQTNHDCASDFLSGTSFRPFANVAAGNTAQPMMTSSTPSTATGRVKYRLSVPSGQAAGVYSNIVNYILTGTY